MAMLSKVGRLFTIKTRTEAWLVIYAIAVGAMERARHYVELYPGNAGLLLALACTGVVFIAGAKLLDSVRPVPTHKPARAVIGLQRRMPRVTRNRPRSRPMRSGSELPLSLRKD